LLSHCHFASSRLACTRMRWGNRCAELVDRDKPSRPGFRRSPAMSWRLTSPAQSTSFTRSAVACAPRAKRRILLTGSIAGFMPGSYQAVYNGTKAFLDSFSYALREETQGHWRAVHLIATENRPGLRSRCSSTSKWLRGRRAHDTAGEFLHRFPKVIPRSSSWHSIRIIP
jgi:NAD(P)-dependent dehydrogenase (short-subunit alcohol dehydrogenase family)